MRATTTSRAGLARWLVTAVMGLVALGAVGLNVALPDLVHDLDASTAELQWIINSYTLAFAGLLLAGATLGDRFGRVRTLQVGLLAYAACSVVAAFVTTPLGLVLARGGLGAASAFTAPITLAIVSTLSDDPRDRDRAVGLWAAMGATGTALGPVVGGLLLSRFWWGSLFLVNVVPSLLLCVAIGRCVPESRDTAPGRFDPIGTALSFVALVGLVWAVIDAPERGWTSATTVVTAGMAILLVAVFVWWELHTDDPMLELSYLRDARFSAATAACTASMFAFACQLLLVSLLLPPILHAGPLGVGLRLLPFAVAMLAASSASSVVAARLGTKHTVALGLVLSGAGAATLASFGDGSSYGIVLVAVVLSGTGMGIGTTEAIAAAMHAVPATRAGLAAGFSAMTRQVATILAVAVSGSVLASVSRSRLAGVPEQLGFGGGDAARSRDSVTAALDVASGTGGRSGRLLAAAARGAFVEGVRAASLVAVAVTLAGVVLTWWFVPSRADPDGVALTRRERARRVQGMRANQSSEPSAVSSMTASAMATNHPVTSRYSVRNAIRDWISR